MVLNHVLPSGTQEAPSTLSGSDIKRSGSSTFRPLVRTRTRRSPRLSETPDLFVVSELLADLDASPASDSSSHHSAPPSARQHVAKLALTFATRPERKARATQTKGSILQPTHSNLASAPDLAEVLSDSPKRPAFTLPKATEYARARMAAILALIARGGGRVDFANWEEVARLLDQAGLIQKAHPSNLRHWVEELKACKIVRQGSPGWIVYPPGEDLPKRKLPYSRPASGLRISAMWSCEELIAAGFSELETLLEGGRA